MSDIFDTQCIPEMLYYHVDTSISLLDTLVKWYNVPNLGVDNCGRSPDSPLLAQFCRFSQRNMQKYIPLMAMNFIKICHGILKQYITCCVLEFEILHRLTSNIFVTVRHRYLEHLSYHPYSYALLLNDP